MIYAPLISFVITLLVSAILLSSKVGKAIKDVPNERSLHKMPTPRVGGIGLIVGVLAGWLTLFNTLMLWILLPLLFLFSLSLIDDIRSLSVRIRFLMHFIAAASVVWGMGLFAENLLIAVMIILGTVWIINLYNFMDGSDGLAGGMAFFGFSSYGAAALVSGDKALAMMCFSVATASLGFLYFNFYPAKVFMGDAGSIPLGFLAAAMGLMGWSKGVWPIWFPIVVFSPFILDATITLLKRGLRGERVWQAHREHYYQRLVQLGAGHRNTALIEYLLMGSVGMSALWVLQHPDAQLAMWIIWSLIYVLAIAVLDFRWKVHQRA
jgi:UDP-N-acetylmuramyl pentapeptide phosphotransferase/UDP-N-acetylglucosamine-1-phosphate transferase